ncbi:MAG TPA: hypothetical protein VF577_07680 [Allosphingosinicella sp.]
MKYKLLAACAAAAFAFPGAAQHAAHSQHAPAPTPVPAPTPAPAVPEEEDHSQHGDDAVTPSFSQSTQSVSRGALGPYPMQREASGTAWQPDSSSHAGIHRDAGRWSLMGHALLNAVYDWQQGPRGDEMGFVSGMLMGSARRNFPNGNVLQLRAMLSPDPLMGARGYPLHLAAGETADGATTLVDRQHPHDLFMELSASYSVRLGERASAFVYGGLPGAPAFGPPAFMHRASAMDSPEAPISHHWLDSTHIAFGVVTAGVVFGDVMIEGSRFNGREPNEQRWDIETGALDSTAARLSINPTRNLSMQASWAHLVAPEQLEPDENETRWSASAIWTRRVGTRTWLSTTLAWGRRSAGHDELDAFALEGAAGLGDWTLFARAEHIETNELLSVGGHHGPTFEVAKVSAGLIRDVRVAEHVRLGIGGLYALNFVPNGLETSYGGDPDGAMLFLRLRID